MPANSDHDLIQLCKQQIAEKLQLGGSSGQFRSRDLEYLANEIEAVSGIKLSISTLKRIWKKDYDQMPHPATLNALVAILGFEDWQRFRQHFQETGAGEPLAANTTNNFQPLIIPLLLCSLLFLAVFNRTGDPSEPAAGSNGVQINGEVIFSADKMESVGVPNSVIFHYDVSQVKADSFFIQQSWNPRNKIRIDPQQHYLSDIYYTPGFHYARLIANDSILQFLPVHIRTDGWLSLVKYNLRDKLPIYLSRLNTEKNGTVSVDENILREAGVDTGQDFFLRYYQIRDFGEVYFDNFSLKTRLRNDSIRNTICPLMELMIITEVNVSFVSFSPKGCVANLGLLIGEQQRRAADNDLSAFGTDVYNWQDVELRVVDKLATVYLNKQAIYELPFQDDFGKVVGVIVTFKGSGSVDGLSIESIPANSPVSVN